MAKSSTVQLNIDVSEFRKGLAAAKAETEKFGGTLEDTIANSEKAVEGLGKGFDRAASASAKSVGDIKKAIAAMIVAGQNSGDAFDTLIAELKKAEAEANSLKAALKEVDNLTVEPEIKIDTEGAKAGIAGIGGSIKDAFAQAKQGDFSGLGNLGSIAAGAVPGIGLATEAIGKVTEVLGNTVEAGTNFDKALKQISISTGLTGGDLKVFEGQARAAFLGGVGETADEAVKIVGQLQQTLGKNIDTKELAKVATRSNQVAQSLGVETPELVGKLSPLIKQYGISFDEALNLVASGAQNGVADIGGYLDAINEFTPNLKEAGFSAEEFQGLLAKAGEQGVKDFAKVGDGVKELQNRIKSGDLTTQLEGIGGATAKSLKDIAKLGQQGALSGAEVLRQSVGEIDKAFASGQITEALRGQLLTTLGGSIAEDLGSEVYSKIFGAPIDTKAIGDKAKQAGAAIDAAIPPPDLGRIFTDLQTQVGRALNFLYQNIIGPIIGPLIDAFKEAGAIIGQVFGGEGDKAAGAFAILKDVLSTVAKVIAGQLVNTFRILATVINLVTLPIRALRNFIVFLVEKLLDAIGVSGKLSDVFKFLGDAANYVQTYIGTLFEAVNTLVNGLANLDPAEIAKGWDQLNNVAANTSKKLADGAKKATDETKKQAEATKENAAATKDKGKGDGEASEEAKKLAEALKAAREALAGLNKEQAKAREIATANLIADETDRQKALLAIDERFALAALEAERKALTSRGALRRAEEAVINKKIEILKEDNANKLREIEGKAETDRFNRQVEAEKKIAEITTKAAEDRVAKLKEVLEAGGIGVAGELVKAQRAIVDAQLSDTIDAIAEATPGFKSYAAQIGSDLAKGLINADEAKRRTESLRQGIVSELLDLPADSENQFALQLREAYSKAADQIAVGTKEVTDAVRKATGKSGIEQYLEGISNVRESLSNADFAGPFEKAREATAGLNEEQEKLIQSVKDGEESYQSAAAKFAEIDAKRKEDASATASVVGEAFRAIAQSQLDAAKSTIDGIAQLRTRNEEIAKELVEIEKRKNAALEELRKKNFDNAQLYAEAEKKITDAFALDKKKLETEQTANNEKAAEAQSAALLQIGTSAGAAFAGLLTGSQDASEALKGIVSSTVSALLDLYTPTIVAGFANVIPGPFGIIAGFAAVASLKALLSAAISGFAEGGFTGNVGTSQVAGVVHGQEFVVNARNTAKNRDLLEHINRGGSVDTFGSAPVTELQMMRAELQAIRQRLDTMPNGINGRQAVSVDVGFDTYLYERDRRRAAVRSLRG